MSHITMKDVRKSYRMGSAVVNALNGLSFEVEAGEFEGILGPSGSGKTTFLNSLGGLESADSGAVTVGGQNIAGIPDHDLTQYRRYKVGFGVQFCNLLPTLTAEENVAMSAEMVKGQGRDPRVVLEQVGLGDRLDHYPGQLSGGQQQRVAIARALAKNPALVLADEPTGSLDVQTGIDVLKVMRQMNRETGQTIVLVTHNSAIAGIADRVIRVSSGQVYQTIVNDSPYEPDEVDW